MAEMDRGTEEDPRPAGTGQDDHDILTYAEAGARLPREIAAQRALVDELSSTGRLEDLEKARARLVMLTEALERNTNRASNGDNFRKFFGYEQPGQRDS